MFDDDSDVFDDDFVFFKAGIASAANPEQLLIALEPEAASVHCREKKMRDFTSERGDAGISDVFARRGAKYLVIDIGGKHFTLRGEKLNYKMVAMDDF